MRLVRFLILVVALFNSGCATVSYTSQAVFGQLDIFGRTRPIADVMADQHGSGVSSEIRARLATVLRVRDFATRELQLPDNGSYTLYAELDRPAVAWNVIATPALSLTPREWCYPFSGCVPYRGYFARERALREAKELRGEGLDVRVASVSAYSTLGWFRDPVFSSQLKQDDAILAGVIFHELAHQQLYLPGDAAFNESFATTVEMEGLRRWLRQENNPQAEAAALAELRRREEFVDFVLPYRKRLEEIFSSRLGNEEKLTGKAKVYAELKSAWPGLEARWGGGHGYEHWFAQELNNAHLAGVGLYHGYVPAFTQLLRELEDDLVAFYRVAHALSQLPAAEREERLEALTRRNSAAAQ
jgi:predicted aminopeptidase